MNDSQATEISPDMSVIDIHAHAVPAPFVEEVTRARLGGVEGHRDERGYHLAFPGEKPLRPVAGVMTEFAARTPWLDAQGVGTQIVAPWLDVHGQQLPATDGQAWVRLLNDCMAAAVAESGGRLLAHATVHLASAEGAALELERAHHELGMNGCMIPTNVPGGFLDERRYDALWAAAAALGTPVILHPPTVAPSAPVFERYQDLRALARAIDTTVVAAALITTGVLKRHPGLRLVLVHGGGYLPYQIERLDQAFEGSNEPPPSHYVRRLLYDTTALTPQAVRLLLDYAGPDRVMVGSDYAATSVQPAWPAGKLTDSVYRALPGQDPDLDLVLRANARRNFSLPDHAPAGRTR